MLSRLTFVPLLTTLTLACAAAPSRPPRATVLLSVRDGGTISTLDPERPRVEALAVEGGRVVASGSRDELRAAYPAAARIDLGGKAVLPGFIDAHVHARELGADALRIDVSACLDVACMVERLRQREPEPAPDRWLVGDGWDEGAWASQGYPDRAALDAAFPRTPVLLSSRHGFATLVNGAALRRAGIDHATPDPEGGTIVRDPDGRPTGVLLTLAQDLVRDVVPPLPDPARRQAILAALHQLAAAGVTQVHEAGMSTADVAAFTALAEDGALPIRVYGLLDGNDPALVDQWLERGPRIDPDDRLTVRGFKVFYDGSLGSRTALLTEPYADDPRAARPTERISPEAVEALALRAARGGFQLAVHAIGDEANARVLALFERVFAAVPGDHRWRLEHAQVMPPGGFELAARLGVIANMQPSHAVGDRAWAEDRLGPERITRAYAWRSMLEAGVPLVLSSDLPGEPWAPLQTLDFAITRQPLDRSTPPWHPEQALRYDEALRAMTLTAAYAGFAEGRLGQLVPGAWADLVVLDRGPDEAVPGRVHEVRVERTFVGGRELPR
ncbi:MAG: amidohydrolase [Nannocystaceae bacterium]